MSSQGIQLKQSQQQKLTPQLKQSLNILMFSSIELEQEVNSMLEKNIMLEEYTEDDFLYDSEQDADSVIETTETTENIIDELDIDAEWQDVYEPEVVEKSNKNTDSGDGFQEDWVESVVSFDEKLESSIRLAGFSNEEMKIAEFIISNLDEKYFLPISIDKIAKKISSSESTVKYVVDTIRYFDPAGVASFDIKDCLLAQLQVIANSDESHINAYLIIKEYFVYITEKPELIKSRLNLSDSEYDDAMIVIKSLTPYPNKQEEKMSAAIRPDVFVYKKLGMYYATGNKELDFNLNINKEYSKLADSAKGDDKNYLKAQLQEASWFIKALDKRVHTVVRVANVIVMLQQDFFIEGIKGLKSMLMKDVAEILEINESTVSRAVNDKYMSFNHKLYEMKFFFTKNLSNDVANTEVTPELVKKKIKDIIESEDKTKPLSDTKIEAMLQEQGIDIARRTIGKYRESIGILSTGKRKVKN